MMFANFTIFKFGNYHQLAMLVESYNGQLFYLWLFNQTRYNVCFDREYLRGKYHCTVDLLFDWFGLVCFENKKQKLSVVIQLLPNQSRGGQQYSDTSFFSYPWFLASVLSVCANTRVRTHTNANRHNIYLIMDKL
jgi:hypothetical protein